MGEVFPISCISCRRKKIKCNKHKPCNQCQKRQIFCNFPSKFRNIRINEDELDHQNIQRSNSSSTVSGGSFHSEEVSGDRGERDELGARDEMDEKNEVGEQLPYASQKLMSLSEEVRHLNLENKKMAEDNKELKKKYQKLLERVSNHRTEDIHQHGSFKQRDPIIVSGETSELGDKYYGPQSSDFMIKNLDSKNDDKGEKANTDTKASSDYGPKDLNSKSIKTDSIDLEDSGTDISLTENHVKNSLLKKPLPYLLDIGSDLIPKRNANTDLKKLNFSIICQLVDYFFNYHPYYKTFISRTHTMEFLKAYDSMDDNDWENDDELLLLVIILLLLIQRLTAKEFVDLNLIGDNDSQIQKFKRAKNHLCDILYHRFANIRHNLINEAITTVQAYILCTEWHFIEQKYEECWSMMFHTCSISYSIGLHVMGNHGLMNEQSAKEKEQEFIRYRVWFALKNISGQICSVLGRPNPISINVNSPILKPSGPDRYGLDLYKYKMLAFLKTGLSECLKLSNMMLIENFMIDFTIEDLLKLDSKFKEDIGLLEWLVHEKLYDNDNLVGDQNSEMLIEDSMFAKIDSFDPVLNKTNLLIDLISFYINRAKLYQPFINKLVNEKAKLVIQLLYDSVIKFLDCTIYFTGPFLKQFGEKYKQDDFKFIRVTNFGKLMRIHFPFLNSFIYQGMIVIFTFLHFKFKSFVEYDESASDQSINYSKFLKELESKLRTLYNIETDFNEMTGSKNKIWSSNIYRLMFLNLQQIEKINYNQSVKLEIQRQNFENDLNELNHQISLGQIANPDLEGFNFQDPFWITNPDNLPYHLSSPSDEDEHSSILGDIRQSGNFNSSQNAGQKSYKDFQPTQETSNMLIDNLEPQTDPGYNNIWTSSRSFPASSNSSSTHNFGHAEQHPTLHGSYQLSNRPQQVQQPIHNTPNYGTSSDFFPSEVQRSYSPDLHMYDPTIQQLQNTSMDNNETEFNPDMI